MEHINNDHSQNGGIAYEYQINRTRKSPGTENARRKQSSHYKPNFKEYTLIRVDGRGKTLSQEKIIIDVNKYFKAA